MLLNNFIVQSGDALFYWGKDDFVSDAIEFVTHGPSHVATVYDLDLTMPDGSKQTEWHVIESTIINGVSGVQLNTLASRINGYDGAIALAPLSPRIREFLDWQRLWGCANHKLGVVKYNVLEIGAYLANIALPGALQINKSNPDAVVCSELRAELLQAGGLPGLDPFRTPPEALFKMRMYGPLTVVAGSPPHDGFNSI